MELSFSIVLPTFNEAPHIGRCIQSVTANTLPGTPYDLVVVDNGSQDKTVEIVQGMGVPVIENRSGRRRPIGVLRNIGAHHSKGTVIAFLDGDMVVPPNWLDQAARYFLDGFTGVLGFVDVAPESAGWVGYVWGNRLFQRLDTVKPVSYLPGRNLFINRSVFEAIHGFDDSLTTNEDKDLVLRVLRAGYGALSIPVTVTHLGYERSLPEFLKKEFWRQGSTIAFVRQRGLTLSTLRNPLLSFGHLCLMVATVLSAPIFGIRAALLLLLLWILPAVVITARKIDPKHPHLFRMRFALLTFLRWNVSGVALAWQVVRGEVKG